MLKRWSMGVVYADDLVITAETEDEMKEMFGH